MIDHDQFSAVCTKIDSCLSKRKVKYTVSHSEHEGMVASDYSIFIGSFECMLTVYESGDCVEVIFSNGDDDTATYEETDTIDNPDEWEPDSGLDDLIDYVGKLAKAETKIASFIQKIEDVCIEYELDVDNYITVVKDF